jgi:hypothetical protein
LLGLLKIIVYSSLFSSAYLIAYVLYTLGFLPSNIFIDIFADQSVGVYEGLIETNLPSISSLIFTIPFLWSLMILLPKNHQFVSRIVLLSSTALSTLAMFLTGRRALWLSVFASILLLLFARLWFLNKRRTVFFSAAVIRRYLQLGILAVLIAIGALEFFKLDPNVLLNNFLQAFSYDNELSAQLRFIQFESLIDGWMKSPIFGVGHGGSASVIRSSDQPWAYELSYVALLFHTGVVGAICYFLSVVWIYWKGIKIISSNGEISVYLLSVLTGTTSFLIANGTNPYLTKYDYMWVIFLPMAFINFYLLNYKTSTKLGRMGDCISLANQARRGNWQKSTPIK